MSVNRSSPNPNSNFPSGIPRWLIIAVLVALAVVVGIATGATLNSVEVGITAAALSMSLLRDIFLP